MKMRQKIIATGAGVVLVGLATVGAFAAQHATTTPSVETIITVTGTVTDTATATETGTAEATQTESATATETPGATDTAVPGATETATSEATSTSESGQRDIKGISTDNPGRGHRDGLCVKITPSGVQVRVPCHAHGAQTPTPTATATATAGG